MTFDEWTDAISTRVNAAMPDVYVKRKLDDLCRWIHGGKECQTACRLRIARRIRRHSAGRCVEQQSVLVPHRDRGGLRRGSRQANPAVVRKMTGWLWTARTC